MQSHLNRKARWSYSLNVDLHLSVEFIHFMNLCFYCSILENIRVRRAGYCYRQKYEIFLERLVFCWYLVNVGFNPSDPEAENKAVR